ncbi:DSBA-like thioredoxin domain-containing protein [Niveomyces insectorum RCEF 264]|uniref:DSBA-like thioredoxin domain-containing protein n=1 Tax=Niveomyces insectorum RCEF 264 TaxID=1081102 RepID=A0A167N2Y6_9HYPO|nr:DSBA-like thioredoxin domain-containing protein [Niveomyces insectorum RCEF 264]
MGGRIDVYLDIASLYSYLCFIYLRRDTPIYAAHGVEVVYHPVLLGAINQATGNRPPSSLPAKARHGVYDVRRSCARAGVPATRMPPDFMKRALTILPLRALHHIQQHYPAATFVAAFHYLFYVFWTPPNADLRDPAVLRAALCEAPVGFGDDSRPAASADGGACLFAAQDVDAILQAAGEPAAKDLLRQATDEALARGAYGAPWLWVRNDAGEEEPFFGSDRFHFVYQFLGLPYQDVALLKAPQAERAVSDSKL